MTKSSTLWNMRGSIGFLIGYVIAVILMLLGMSPDTKVIYIADEIQNCIDSGGEVYADTEYKTESLFEWHYGDIEIVCTKEYTEGNKEVVETVFRLKFEQ